VVMFYRLRNIDNVNFIFEVKKVILRQISMNELASLIHAPDNKKHLFVTRTPVIDLSIFKSWSCNTIFANEIHDYNIVLEYIRNGAFNNITSCRDTFEISDFFFSP
jgi:hypothetical protein